MPRIIATQVCCPNKPNINSNLWENGSLRVLACFLNIKAARSNSLCDGLGLGSASESQVLPLMLLSSPFPFHSSFASITDLKISLSVAPKMLHLSTAGLRSSARFIRFECWRTLVDSSSSKALSTSISASETASSVVWMRVEMGTEGWMGPGVDNESGGIPAIHQQFWMVVVSTLLHAMSASRIALSWLMS